MSKLRKLNERISSFAGRVDAEVKHGQAVDASKDFAMVEAAVTRVSLLDDEAVSISETLGGFVRRAKETNPDKLTYGPKTSKRVLEMNASFEGARSSLADISNAVQLSFAPLSADARVAAEKEAEAAAAEEERKTQLAAEETRQRAMKSQLLLLRQEQEAAAHAATQEAQEQARVKAAAKRVAMAAERRRQEAAALAMVPMDALTLLLSQTAADRASRQVAISALRTILGNVTECPEEPQWRRLRQSNARLQREVLRWRGGRAFLLSCGFRVKILRIPDVERLQTRLRRYYEMFAPKELPENGGRADVVKLAQHFAGSKSSELWQRLREKYGHSMEEVVREEKRDATMPAEGDSYLVLEEPPVSQAEKWSAWYDRLQSAQVALQTVRL